jgi:hypothetical protein
VKLNFEVFVLERYVGEHGAPVVDEVPASGQIRDMRVEDEGGRGPECRGRRPAADTRSPFFPSLGSQHSCTLRSLEVTRIIFARIDALRSR